MNQKKEQPKVIPLGNQQEMTRLIDLMPKRTKKEACDMKEEMLGRKPKPPIENSPEH